MKSFTQKATVLILAIFIISVCAGCSGKKVPSMLEMTKKDKEFDSYARKAAEEVLEKEVNDITWATVETGDLEYMYTLYCKEDGLYTVYYITKFDESGDPEDEWLKIEITLTEQKHVSDTSCAYVDVHSYETTYGSATLSMTQGDKEWININNAEDTAK